MTIKPRWKQRLTNWSKALSQLEEFLEKESLNKFEEQGLIQAFEYNHELAWLTLKDLLEFQGHQNLLGSRDVTRKAFAIGLLEDEEVWINMIKSRNLTSHSYNQEIAEVIAKTIVDEYYPAFHLLHHSLTERVP